VDPSTGYEWYRIGPADTPFTVLRRLQESGKNYLVTLDTVHRNLLNRLKSFRREQFPGKNSLLIVLTEQVPVQYQLEFEQEVTPMSLKNVVGVLPGRKRPEEYVIYSGHYDHLGIGKPDKEGDSIFNGANDDGAGTTAVMMLARYFAQQKTNERTLIFAAFTAEEVGGYGSQYFSRQYDPKKVVAMFNIEMIGTESKWGPDAAYITGYEKSDMGQILQKNLTGTPFRFYPDPYTTQNLFYRSDNATLARLGVPAHTISTSRMEPDPQAAVKEVDKYYHTLNDEMETLDMKNMAAIIRAIALSSLSIVNGTDTPSRVDPATVR
jgi:Zn-dependent M28 family amino/carboxypeptidase